MATRKSIAAAAATLRQIARPWSGVACRATAPNWANRRDIASGLGAAHRGGRWNVVGRRAVYLAEDRATAAAETDARLRGLGLDDALKRFELWDIRLGESVRAEVDAPAVLAALGMTIDELMEVDHEAAFMARKSTVCQDLGEAAAELGVQVIGYPSRRLVGGRCVVLFPDVPPMVKLEYPGDE